MRQQSHLKCRLLLLTALLFISMTSHARVWYFDQHTYISKQPTIDAPYVEITLNFFDAKGDESYFDNSAPVVTLDGKDLVALTELKTAQRRTEATVPKHSWTMQKVPGFRRMLVHDRRSEIETKAHRSGSLHPGYHRKQLQKRKDCNKLKYHQHRFLKVPCGSQCVRREYFFAHPGHAAQRNAKENYTVLQQKKREPCCGSRISTKVIKL